MITEKLQNEFEICLALTSCFTTLNQVFERSGIDIKLKIESHIIPKEENPIEGELPLIQK
jgi:hypothetical protein